jgi:hypothetical protein
LEFNVFFAAHGVEKGTRSSSQGQPGMPPCQNEL